MEIVIERVGECKRCGFCCGFVDGKITEGSCKHLNTDGSCSIYDKRAEFCNECGHIHDSCEIGPQAPLRKLHPECDYRFYDKKSGAEIINIEFADFDFFTRTKREHWKHLNEHKK